MVTFQDLEMCRCWSIMALPTLVEEIQSFTDDAHSEGVGAMPHNSITLLTRTHRSSKISPMHDCFGVGFPILPEEGVHLDSKENDKSANGRLAIF
mmetsp:Transcript_66/g.158  ORF Transcript_66/g.158 Transcript_66/m.158 type:complete len:95 (-) Transcript_66:276-560(-)